VTLTTEEMGDMPDVDAATMDEVLGSDGFGKFAILSASDGAFIQAGYDWWPGAACEAFMEAHASDPWLLEYRVGGRQFRAPGQATLAQERRAFQLYLDGGSEWRTRFVWVELEL
jgi:hypothetical protein